VIRVWWVRVPWNISKMQQEAVRIGWFRVWWIRVPWNISKMLQEAVRIGWLGSSGLGFLEYI